MRGLDMYIFADSVKTHGDFWEDDMDYPETVSYEGVETKVGTQAKTDEKTCENCPPGREGNADGKALFALEHGDNQLPDANLRHVL